MGNNSHGNNNELEMAKYLNEKKFKDLNPVMKEFIKYICLTKGISYDDRTTIFAEYETNGKLKQDIYITIKGTKIGISLKMGKGNSCHQEKIESFVSFIKSCCKATDEICNLWRLFIWADGTYDGSGSTKKDSNGKIISRFNADYFKRNYENEKNKLQDFLDSNKEIIIERALFIGNHNSNVDFIYHGTQKQGRWISKEEVIKYLINRKSSPKTCLSIGGLSFQSWNASLKGNTEYKRGQIQIKYSKMKEDFDILLKNEANISANLFGQFGEFDLTIVLNSNKKNQMWKTLLPTVTDFANYYLIKVSTKQTSKLSGKKVSTKSDAYIIEAEIPDRYLKEKEYALDEADLSVFKYKIISGTGISIKMKNSKNYTYQKFTQESFCKAFCYFGNTKFWLTALLIYSADSERYKNELIIKNLGDTLINFQNKVQTIMGISIPTTDNSAYWDEVRKNAQIKLKEEINKNKKLQESIFTGKYWFDDPYFSSYLFESGKLKKSEIPPFEITTGSGRSKGKYSIEIKPAKK